MMLIIRPYALEGFTLWTYIIGVPTSFVVGLVPPIMQRKMMKNLSEESINKYAYTFLFCYLFCTLVWSIWIGASFYRSGPRTRFFIFLVTPFTLGTVYGFLVIKRFGREFADPRASHLIYGRLDLATPTD